MCRTGVQDDGKLVGLAAREQEISAAVLAGMAAEVGATSQLLQQLPVGLHRAALYVRVRRASVDHLICSDLCVAGGCTTLCSWHPREAAKLSNERQAIHLCVV